MRQGGSGEATVHDIRGGGLATFSSASGKTGLCHPLRVWLNAMARRKAMSPTVRGYGFGFEPQIVLRMRLFPLGRLIPTLVLLIAAVPAVAQQPSAQQIDKMLSERTSLIAEPDRDYRLPYYRWNDGASISVFIVTDGQTGPCVDIARNAIQRQIDLIRRDVAALQNIRDVVVTDRVPTAKDDSAILIGLPTGSANIKATLAKFALENRPKAKFVDIGGSYGTSHGIIGENDPPDAEPIYEFEIQDSLGLEHDYIVHAYHWSVRLRGLRIYSERQCHNIEWETDLFRLLGSENFVPLYAHDWLADMEPSKKRKWYDLARRLFLKALYGCPASPASRECITSSMAELWSRNQAPPED
jgi:hypothetical protein